MKTVNELIVALVTGSNEASRLEPADVGQMLDLAAAVIRQLGGNRAAESSAADEIAADAARVAAMTPEAWQVSLRSAAGHLRRLQPEVDADRALPAHKPDGGDGGNY